MEIVPDWPARTHTTTKWWRFQLVSALDRAIATFGPTGHVMVLGWRLLLGP